MAIPVLFLDDASKHAGPADRKTAHTLTLELLKTLKRLRKENKRFALNAVTPIAHYEVADGWSIRLILTGNEYREEWDFIRQINNRSPISDGIEAFLQQEMNGVECKTNGGQIESLALAWASFMDSATVSCYAQSDWLSPFVDIKFSCLQDDGSLVESPASVRNASKPEHIDSHIEWLRLLGLSSEPSAQQIWDEREVRFPGLRFLPRVERDLKLLEGASAPFIQAISTLTVLQDEVRSWPLSNPWPEFSTKTSPESDTRKKFCWVEDNVSGREEVFDWHKRFTGNFAGRIHFRVDVDARQIVVAYIGAKLTKNIVG